MIQHRTAVIIPFPRRPRAPDPFAWWFTACQAYADFWLRWLP